ncbi:ATP-binding cassette domain-containing protein [Flaviramulus sp. BrNp1-15]|uniref:ABC transporter ATP-binding protein n=1 Tax=Flaviramulus sp. BrNp1-15 TaxID=2916754 RepID=UPI001EE91992|nr:ATP-binding cassette domain-containing protein [Flaviramulus sp. BrNp1-15]ULC58426.1 ATP-binding cassette domain-containing protein [Flaviramulus sp. BrNp1-15]
MFSEITLNKFIDEETRHGHFDVETKTNNSLKNSSEGERKQALLKHLLLQNPEYIVVDNIFGSLDLKAQKDIEKKMHQLSSKVSVIQITNRKTDILPFITNTYKLKGKTIVDYNEVNQIQNKTTKVFDYNLPKPIKKSKAQYKTLVEFKNVTISYGDRTIIKGITFKIKSGEFCKLTGPNGSGKSTILSMIYGDNPKAYGQNIILFDVKKGSGESVWDIKKKIGYLSSDMVRGFARLDSIGNMIVSGFFDSIGLYKTPSPLEISVAHQWLRVLGMFNIRKQAFSSLSKGHQRLVLIARAMVKQPHLLILDEPTNGLDDEDVILFSELMNKIAKETNTAILYVSHRKEENLKPDIIYELTPSDTGSTGEQIQYY